MKKIFLFITICFTLIYCISDAQDINCNVTVTTPQVQQTDKTIFTTMQKAINEFVKNRKWTPYNFKPEERIECNMQINITERISVNEFKGTIQMQARRPVYKTAYNTVLLNYIDKDFQFKYEETQPLQFDESTNLSDLTSMLAFYINVILGINFDTFSQNGGTQFYTVAQTIVNNAQNSPEPGWKSFESMKNRYWLIENLTNPNYQSFRDALYKYYRLGLDVMYDNIQKGRQEVLESFESLKKVNNEKPGLFLMNIYMFGKVDEIVKLFSEAPQNEREIAVKSLGEFDPANSSKYSAILNNK
jgi:hypothetical protein